MPSQRGSSGDLMLPSAVMQLLPTPTASDRFGPGEHGEGGPDLWTAVTSLLPTPQARDGDGTSRSMSAGTALKRFGQSKRNLDDAIALLPTPTSRDAGRGSGWGGRAGSAVVGDGAQVVADTEGDGWGEVRAEPAGQFGGSAVALSGDRDWGTYATAIQRWELILGRPAPAPTVIGKRGGQQLSPVFTEWLMGWPEGWVTTVPCLSRNDQLKI